MRSTSLAHQESFFAPSEAEILAEYDTLESKLRFVEAPEYAALVNFNKNAKLPIHGWYYFKEGYGSDLILDLLQRYDVPRDGLVLDPFSGSGTTLLTCQLDGRPSVGVEYSPFFTSVARAKLSWWRYDPERLRPLVGRLLGDDGSADELPSLSTFERIYDPATRDALMRAKHFIRTAELEVETDRDFLRLGLAAIVEKVSPARKDGKGLKFHRRRRVFSVGEALRLQYERMLADLDEIRESGRRLPTDLRADVYQGDARDLRQIEDESVAFVVYSPPYLNTFDYSEVYKVELWLFDHVRSAEEFRSYRGQALRSHVSTPVQWTEVLPLRLVDEISWYVAGQRLWNRHIPAMINGYFDDMYLALREQYRVLRPGGKVVCVIGNSSYANLPIPTDALLAKIAELVGFRTVEVLVARHLGTSAQQLACYDAALRERFLRESALVLEK
jgi:DNA modification methylase